MALGLSAQGHKREKVSIDETQVSVSRLAVFGCYWKHALGFVSGPQKGFYHGRHRILHHDLWPWAFRPKATNVKRSLLMKHRLVGIGKMLSASLRALKRGFSMEGIEFDITICGLGPFGPRPQT